MRATSNRLLLLPPKTASRWCQRSVAGEVAPLRSVDLRRHAALHQIPPEYREGREVVVVTRDPHRWYESWWAHMRRQRFDWSKQWGHEPVPEFREALRDYCFGWRERRAGVSVDLAGAEGLGGGDGGVADHLANQAVLRCGWWSYMMRWTAGENWSRWNQSARWVFVGPDLDADLRAAGFKVSATAPVGAGSYERPEWDDEMRSWVAEADGETLKLVRARTVSASLERSDR